MAYAIINNQFKYITHEQAVRLWQVLIGEQEGTPEQQAFAATVGKVYMNRHKAPQSYIEHYRQTLKAMGKPGE